MIQQIRQEAWQVKHCIPMSTSNNSTHTIYFSFLFGHCQPGPFGNFLAGVALPCACCASLLLAEICFAVFDGILNKKLIVFCEFWTHQSQARLINMLLLQIILQQCANLVCSSMSCYLVSFLGKGWLVYCYQPCYQLLSENRKLMFDIYL